MKWWSLGILLSLFLSVAEAQSCEVSGKYVIDKQAGEVSYQKEGETALDAFVRRIVGIDIWSFQPFIEDECENPYAIDKNNVYFEGEALEGLNPDEFTTSDIPGVWTDGKLWVIEGEVVIDELVDLGYGYYQLGYNYFYEGNKIPFPIQKVEKGYAVTHSGVYKNGEKTLFDPNTFRAFDNYIVDSTGVYYVMRDEVTLLDGADNESFSVFGNQKLLAADENQFYFEGHVIGSSAPYIEYYSHGFFRDENQVYFYETPLYEFDADSFKVHFKSGKYLQDKNGVYYVTRLNFRNADVVYEKLPDFVDGPSFEVIRYNLARDKNVVYEGSEIYTGSVLEDLKNQAVTPYSTEPKMRMNKPMIKNTSRHTDITKSIDKKQDSFFFRLLDKEMVETNKVTRIDTHDKSSRVRIPRRSANDELETEIDTPSPSSAIWGVLQRLLNWLFW